MPPLSAEMTVADLPGIERTLELARVYLDMDMALLIDHGAERDTLGDITGAGIDIGPALRLTHIFTERSRRGRRWRVVGDTSCHSSSAALAKVGVGAFVSAKVITADGVAATLTCLSREPMGLLGAKEGRVLCVLADRLATEASNLEVTAGSAPSMAADPAAQSAHPIERPPARQDLSVMGGPVVLCPLCQRKLIQLNHRIGDRDVNLRACGHCDLRWWQTDGLSCTLPDLLDIVREDA